MPKIEVIFSPALYRYRTLESGFVTAVVDVLRATTSFCAAFDAGVESILPVAGLEELRNLKSQGYLTAAERDGRKVDFADFGNSPIQFLRDDLRGKKLAYSTTNGTHAIELAKPDGSIVIASFADLEAITTWLTHQQNDVLILCSGWKNAFSLEDSVCAGALVAGMLESGGFEIQCDSAIVALNLWSEAKDNLQQYCSKGTHYRRLEKLGLQDDLDHCFTINTSDVVPVWNGERLVRDHVL